MHNDYEYDFEYGTNYSTTGSEIKRIVAAFLVGGIVASVITLFMAPVSGRKARAVLKKGVDEIRSRAEQTIEAIENGSSRVKSAIEDTPSRAKEVKGMVKDTVDDVSQTAKRRAAKLKEVGRAAVKDQKESLHHAADEAVDVLKHG